MNIKNQTPAHFSKGSSASHSPNTLNSKEKNGIKFKINFSGLSTVIRTPTLLISAKVVLINLLLYAGVEGESYPSKEKLGKDLGLTSRQIGNLVKILKDNKLIAWKKGGFGRSNRYTFNKEIYFPNDNSVEKSATYHSRSGFPAETGKVFPTKVVNEKTQLSGVTLQLFEKTSKTQCAETERRRLNELCAKHSEAWVEDAIREAGNRNLPFIKVGLIAKILEDWSVDGKPEPKPKFNPCGRNGCENGMIFKPAEGVARPCECRESYEKQLEK